MGIDAEILLRVRGDKPTDRQISVWADGLCRSIGAKHFFIYDGLPQPEYSIANEAWSKALDAHPLNAEWESLNSSGSFFDRDQHKIKRAEDLRKQILSDIGEHPTQRRRAIELTNYIYPADEENGIPAEYAEPGRCYLQDGDTIYAKQGEWLLTVSLWSRYYGIGYERGDLLTICAVAEWCEANIPNCEVWYGGDSSGCCAEPFPEKARAALRKHMYSQHGRDYYMFGGKEASNHPSPCGLCVDGGKFAECGWGGNYSAVHCASCGKTFETRDGANWTEQKEAA